MKSSRSKHKRDKGSINGKKKATGSYRVLPFAVNPMAHLSNYRRNIEIFSVDIDC